MKIPQEKDIHYQNMLQAGRAMQDAENFAIKLLATRLGHSFNNIKYLAS